LLKDRTAGAFSFLGNSSHSEALNKLGLGEKSKTKVLDPQGPFLQRWNKIFVISCLFAVFVDPLFLYVPVIDGGNNCLYLDKKLETTASILRFFTDIFYLLHILFQFRTGFIAPSSRVFGRGALVKDTFAIAKRYLSTLFLVDFLAVLPLPQVLDMPSTQ
jgi:cyclic nucleotide gated channel, plant